MSNLAVPGLGTFADVGAYMQGVGEAARAAARDVARADTHARNAALMAMAAAIRDDAAQLIAANAEDVAAARAAGHDAAFVDRLTLDADDDRRDGRRTRGRSPRCPIPSARSPISSTGLPASRSAGCACRWVWSASSTNRGPNVTADAAGLCLKAGNATHPSRRLRGDPQQPGHRESVHRGLRAAGLPENAVQIVATTDRAAVGHLIADDKHVDVIVPRGGKSLIERIAREAKVPVIKHLDGVCHVYIDADADLAMAIAVADNAKTQRYSPCNTMETLLVHAGIAARVLPPLAAVYAKKGVELRGCERSRAHRSLDAARRPRTTGTPNTWRRSWRCASSTRSTRRSRTSRKYGSQHTDAIVTEHHGNAMRFLREVDSSSVMVNASTRLRRRLRIRIGRRNRHLDQQAARARAGGPRGPHQPQVDRAGIGPAAHLNRR